MNNIGDFLKEEGLVKDTKISEKILKHAKEINRFQDKIFKLAEIEQATPVESVGGATAFAVSMLAAYEKENPEMATIMRKVVKRMFTISGVEI